jgi:hypothetical protein
MKSKHFDQDNRVCIICQCLFLRLRSDPVVVNKDKIYHLNLITEILCSSTSMKYVEMRLSFGYICHLYSLFISFRVNADHYNKCLAASVEALFLNCDESDFNVRLAVDKNISKLVKVRFNHSLNRRNTNEMQTK